MKRWKPKENETYYYISETYNDLIIVKTCTPDGCYFSNKTMECFPLGYYKTKREAQAMIRKINKLVWGK